LDDLINLTNSFKIKNKKMDDSNFDEALNVFRENAMLIKEKLLKEIHSLNSVNKDNKNIFSERKKLTSVRKKLTSVREKQDKTELAIENLKNENKKEKEKNQGKFEEMARKYENVNQENKVIKINLRKNGKRLN